MIQIDDMEKLLHMYFKHWYFLIQTWMDEASFQLKL